ncbi:MAG: hypothetical protein NTV94_10740 [Planctomycetota bacterium]|nr:hypothetical protein [Planctomycetota bacterium]
MNELRGVGQSLELGGESLEMERGSMLRAWQMSRVVSWMVLVFAAACAVSGASAAVDNPEIEPNDTKGSATMCLSGGPGMSGLDTISGTTTGSGTGSGPTSSDYFLLKTASSALSIYRYQLVLSSARVW